MKLKLIVVIVCICICGGLIISFNSKNTNKADIKNDLHVYKTDNLKVYNGTLTGIIYSDDDYSSMPKQNTLNITTTLLKDNKSIGKKTFTVKNVPLGDLYNFSVSNLDNKADNIVVNKIIINN